ncbi:hypothetical protein HanIR_Chr12g0603971 [Helianthus annuus]|nr:hypothetical protein HanIR_Chr12g0603971 [Helianthus annuus]
MAAPPPPIFIANFNNHTDDVQFEYYMKDLEIGEITTLMMFTTPPSSPPTTAPHLWRPRTPNVYHYHRLLCSDPPPP